MRQNLIPQLFVLGVCCLGGASARADTVSAWVQYAAGGQVEVRAVADAAVCPEVAIDGTPRPMALRRSPDPRFPIRICAATVPAGTKSLVVDGRALPVPVARPRRLVILGDTGCRLKGNLVQACNDPKDWPFPHLAEAAARERPDLVIHVGDYLYRESACPAGDARCAGTPWGDNWQSWQADFLVPASALLSSAVWVVERGNHEDCRRAGGGWTALLSADPPAGPCGPHDHPYLVDLGEDLRMAVVDDSNAADMVADAAVAKRLKADLVAVMAAKPGWLLTHHPVRGIFKKDRAGRLLGANATLLRAFLGVDDSSLNLLLSGHIHTFQVENFAGRHPPQLVAGGGGDLLDRESPPAFSGRVGGREVSEGASVVVFGYLVMDRQADGWDIELKDPDGMPLRHCHLHQRSIDCTD